jgi:hypothetical protein
MPAGMQFLASTRLTTIARALEDPRLLPGQLIHSQRVLDSDSWDGDIIARDQARTLIADIIADDAQGGTYATGKLWTETFNIPNLKIGVHFKQEEINQLLSLGQAGVVPASSAGGFLGEGGNNLLNSIVQKRLDMVRLGIAQRKEALIIAMELDALSYNRLGIQIVTSWGMPAEFKTSQTGNRTWDNPTTATPITDVLLKKQYIQRRTGRKYNRMDMTTTDLMYAVNTAEFAAKARTVANTWGPWGGGSAPIPVEDLSRMQSIFETLTQMQIVLNDNRVWQQNEDASLTQIALWPVGTVMFSNRDDDGNREVMDVADAIVTESIVAQLMDGSSATVGRVPAGVRGPLVYATGRPDLNPPQFTLWGVKRCFPRKKDLTATAVMVVGTYTDDIPTTEIPVI